MDKWQRRLLIAFMTLCLLFKTVLAVVPVVAKTALHYFILLARKAGGAALRLQTATALSVGCFIFDRRVYQLCEVILTPLSRVMRATHADTIACAFGVAPPKVTGLAVGGGQDALKGGGKAAVIFHACTSAAMAVCVFLSPGLITWPFHVAAFSWCHLLWRPHWAVSLAQLLLLWRECPILPTNGNFFCT